MKSLKKRRRIQVLVAAAVALVLAVALVCEIIIGVGAWSEGGVDLARRGAPIDPTIPNVQAIGNLLYTRYLFVFEAAGLVLLVAMIGAIVLTLRHREHIKRQDIPTQVARSPKTAVEVVKVKSGQGL